MPVCASAPMLTHVNLARVLDLPAQPQPNMYAAFTDSNQRAWSLHFASQEDFLNVAKKVRPSPASPALNPRPRPTKADARVLVGSRMAVCRLPWPRQLPAASRRSSCATWRSARAVYVAWRTRTSDRMHPSLKALPFSYGSCVAQLRAAGSGCR